MPDFNPPTISLLPKVNKSYTLTPEALALLAELADKYESSRSGTLDSLIKMYAPTLIAKV